MDLVELHPVNIQLSLADIQHFGFSFRSDSSSFWRLLLGPLLGLLLLYFKTQELLLLILCRTIVELIAWKLSCSFYRLNFSRFLYYIFRLVGYHTIGISNLTTEVSNCFEKLHTFQDTTGIIA